MLVYITTTAPVDSGSVPNTQVFTPSGGVTSPKMQEPITYGQGDLISFRGFFSGGNSGDAAGSPRALGEEAAGISGLSGII